MSGITSAVNTLFPGNQGITQNKEAGTDSGVDVSLPANYVVPATASGMFRKDLSTLYQQTFQIGTNLFESFVHVLPLPGGEPSFVRKGQPVGVVTGQAGKYADSGVTYHSTGPHTEVDFANNPTGPGSFFSSGTLDPYPILESQAGGAASPYFSPASGPAPVPGLNPGTSGVPATPPNSKDSWVIADFGALGNITIPKKPFVDAAIITGIAAFLLVMIVLFGESIIHGGASVGTKRTA